MPKFGLPHLSGKKILLIGFIFAVLIVIPLTVYLVQQQQQTQSRAEKNTTLSFSPPDQTASVGGKVTFDVTVSPGNNQVNFIKLVLKYDSTKLSANEGSFVVNPASNLSILQGPVVGNDNLSVTLSVESDPTKVIQQPTKIGTVTFDVIGASETPTQVSFDPDQIQIRSINGANQDAFNENVFLNGEAANVTILGESGNVSPTETPSGTETPTLTPTISTSPTPTSTESADGTTPSDNQIPICESLATDQSTTGVAPYTLSFTATGTDTDGTVSKASFNFGEGAVEDVTTGGGLGTASVTVAQSHTYETSGTFTATAVLTDDLGGLSDSTSCTVTVTVSSGGTSSESASVTPLANTGPNQAIIGVGALGGILFLIAAFLFLAL